MLWINITYNCLTPVQYVYMERIIILSITKTNKVYYNLFSRRYLFMNKSCRRDSSYVFNYTLQTKPDIVSKNALGSYSVSTDVIPHMTTVKNAIS